MGLFIFLAYEYKILFQTFLAWSILQAGERDDERCG